MSFRTFVFSLSASFGVAWLAIVIIPYLKMRSLETVAVEEGDGTNAVYIPKRAGRIADGAEVYAANGCYQCHSQLARPTYAGNDMFRSDMGGIAGDEDRGDTRRETNAFDFQGEKFAQIGVSRLGPDLSNLGRRIEAIYAKGADPEAWLFAHLYNPRWSPDLRESSCPSFRFLFKVTEIKGNPSDESLPFPVAEGMEISPKPEARALVSYLLSLKKDQPVPISLNFAPPTAAVPKAP